MLNKFISGLASFASTLFLVSGIMLMSEPDSKTHAVTGVVSFEGPIPNLRPINMSSDPACVAKNEKPVKNPLLTLGPDNTMANVLVSIANPPHGEFAPPNDPAILEIKNCMYSPRVMAVMKGQEIKFVNADGILHNIHGSSKANREFTIGMPASMKEYSMTLDKPEPVFQIKSEVHHWMRAYMTVFDHPYFSVTGIDGRFSIPNLPNGTYTIIAWHERLPAMKGTVTVTDSDASINFSFKTPKRSR